MQFTDDELVLIAYALECRFGLDDELAERIYTYMEEKTGEDFRI